MNGLANISFQGATEVMRGTINYNIDKNFGHADPAYLEQERLAIEKGKAQIDPKYRAKINEKLGRKPVAESPQTTYGRSELQG